MSLSRNLSQEQLERGRGASSRWTPRGNQTTKRSLSFIDMRKTMSLRPGETDFLKEGLWLGGGGSDVIYVLFKPRSLIMPKFEHSSVRTPGLYIFRKEGGNSFEIGR